MHNEHLSASSPVKYSHLTSLLLIIFWPLTALVLLCDSRVVAGFSGQGQWWSNLLAPIFLLALMSRMTPQRQLMVALFVPLSALGEAIFSLMLGLYEYRLGAIPLYVPFGHSILMSVGLLLADSEFVQKHKGRVQGSLLILHGGLIGGTLIFFGDTLSTLFAVIFLLLLRGRCSEPFYLILGLLVLYIEIVGTVLGCWMWRPDPFGVLHTTNPPPGAFTCYVIGDILAMQIANYLRLHWTRWRVERGSPAIIEA